MIDDVELASLFRDESEEHLRLLEAGLLTLEKAPDDVEMLEEVLREAHSLKGAARMLDLSDIELLAHALEDRLRAATKAKRPLEPEAVPPLLHAVDALRALCAEALEGVHVDMDVAAAAAAVRGDAADVAPTIDVSVAPAPEATEAPTPEPRVAPAAPPVTTFHVESIRVPPRKLDALMVQAGELVVTRTRLTRRVVDLAALTRMWSDLYAREHAQRRRVEEAGPVDPATAATWDESEVLLRALGDALSTFRDDLAEDIAQLGTVADALDMGVRDIRMLPLSTLFAQFPRMVRDISLAQDKQVELRLEGGDTLADKRILEEIKDPVMHAVRNAVNHGIEDPDTRVKAGKPPIGVITIRGRLDGSSIRIDIEDDGRGLDRDRIARRAVAMGLVTEDEVRALTPERIDRLVFASGLSTADRVTDISGRGVGMDVVRANVESLKGRTTIATVPGHGCTLTFVLPQTLATERVLLVRVAGQVFGIPLEMVRLTRLVAEDELRMVDGQPTLEIDEVPISAVSAAAALGLPATVDDSGRQTAVVLTDGTSAVALLVDRATEEQELVMKPPGALLRRVRNVLGAGILGTGEVCVVLHPLDLIRTVQVGRHINASVPAAIAEPVTKVVLIAEDSAVTRAQLKRILEAAGYRVVAEPDGAAAWDRLTTGGFDAVVSDVMMPRLTGFELAERIRSSKEWGELPVVLVTTLASEEDRRRGLEVGANAYLTKGAFDQDELLQTLAALIGTGEAT